jgi:putative cell wall-binding protein
MTAQTAAHPARQPGIRTAVVSVLTGVLVAGLCAAAPATAAPAHPASTDLPVVRDVADVDALTPAQARAALDAELADHDAHLRAMAHLDAQPDLAGHDHDLLEALAAAAGHAGKEPEAAGGPAPDSVPSGWDAPTAASFVAAAGADLATTTQQLAQEADNGPEAVKAPPSKSLPSKMDAAPGWQYQWSCDPNTKPGVSAFANLISKHYGYPTWWGARSCVKGATSKHYDGRAVDWPLNAYNSTQKAIGDRVASWITANNGAMARRFGIMSVIWNKKSWYLYDAKGGWRTYTGVSPHTDHMHFSFTWDGAMKRTSWWTGKPVTTVDQGACRVYQGQYAPRYVSRRTAACPTNLPAPPKSSHPVLVPGDVHASVKIAQTKLGMSPPGTTFGPSTLANLLKWQKANKVPVTGVLDNATWAKMTAAPKPQAPRIAGADRYATAAKIAASYPAGVPVAYLTTGADYADALSGAALAGATGGPVLLTQPTRLTPAAATQLARLKPAKIVILGGTASVNTAVEKAARKYASNVTRLAGANRYATSAKISSQFTAGTKVAYVATGQAFPDALAGAAVAGKDKAPVLLTRGTGLPQAVVDELRRLKPAKIVVLGGTAAVSAAVQSQLRSLTTGTVTRIAGSDRYEVAANLAASYPAGKANVYVASGTSFPDALAGAAYAAKTGVPVLLTRPAGLPGPTSTRLKKLKPKKITILGGTVAVSTTVAEQLYPLQVK